MPFICLARTDIPESSLQVVDLWPNTSLRNQSVDPPPQTKYLRPTQNDSVVVTGAGPITSVREARGLTVYLMDNVSVAVTLDSLTPVEASAAAAAIIADMRAGTDLTLAVVDAHIAAASAVGTGLDTGASTGVLADLLAVVAGAAYVVPAGSEFEDAGNVFTGGNGSLDSTQYRPTHDGVPFQSSLAEGHLSKMKSSDFFYAGVAGSAITVYANDGTAL